MKLSRIIINAVALIAAALIVPDVHLDWKTDPSQTFITLVVLAVVFGIINAYIRPVLRAVSLPINLISMGLFGFFLNAGLLLLLAWLVDKLWQPVLHLGGFPPDFSRDDPRRGGRGLAGHHRGVHAAVGPDARCLNASGSRPARHMSRSSATAAPCVWATA